MFSERFDKRNKFNFDGSNLPYEKLSHLVEANIFGEGEIVQVLGMFTHNKSKYGKTGVIVTGQYNIDVPDHLIPMIEEVLGDPMLIAGVNDGKCGFCIRSYQDDKGVTRFSGSFVDYKPSDKKTEG